MLAELESLHAELLALIAELEALTRNAEPDRNRLTNIRWKLSRASGRRAKFLANSVYPHLGGAVAGDDADKLNEMRDSAIALRLESARHVGVWSIDNVMADWRGYCRASAAMRNSMRRRIAAEKELLNPLLARSPSQRGR